MATLSPFVRALILLSLEISLRILSLDTPEIRLLGNIGNIGGVYILLIHEYM